eukprot:95958-Chlamydomonas_euryale.AAC.2
MIHDSQPSRPSRTVPFTGHQGRRSWAGRRRAQRVLAADRAGASACAASASGDKRSLRLLCAARAGTSKPAMPATRWCARTPGRPRAGRRGLDCGGGR